MNWHFLGYGVVAIGSVALFLTPFGGRTRLFPFHSRLPLLLLGPVGIAWSIIGFYLFSHTNAQGHTLLPWARFWALDHAKGALTGLAVGLLFWVLTNPLYYKRKPAAALTV
jgi:hypothetical protein